MAQQIFLKRNRDIYNSRDLAVDALNKLTFNNGEPVVVQYVDQATSSVRILLAIGIANGYGPDKYRLIATFSNIEELTGSLQALSAAFSLHEDTMADGTTPGHVYDSTESDLEFKNGIATLKKGSIALDTLEKATAAGVVGVSSSDLSTSNGQVSPKLLNWDTVIQELWAAGYRPINKLTIGGVTLSSKNMAGDDIKITLDSNFQVTKISDNQASLSFVGEITGGGGEGGSTISGELNTIAGPVKVVGSPSSLITSFSEEDITFPIAPSIDTPVEVGSINDTTSSDLVPTVGFVNTKITNALAANDAMHYMGTFNPATQTLPSANAGDMYVISAAGTISGLSSVVHSGDMLICFRDGTPAQYPSNWQIVEVHNGTVMGPSSSVDSDIVAFDGSTGKVVKDSGIKISDIVRGTRRVATGSGLELVGNMSGELGQGDVVVAHSKVTKETSGTGNVVTGIETNDYGHVTKITYGQGGTGSGLEGITHVTNETDGKPAWSGHFVAPGYFVNGAYLENNTLMMFSGKLPGTAKVNEAGTAQYLVDAVVGKSNVSSVNEYPIVTEVANDKLQLSVVINRIDGGEF